MRGDGMTSVEYDPMTGVITIEPDGHPVGLFNIQSTTGIFSGSATFPPGGLVAVNSTTEKSWLGLVPFFNDHTLGAIAPAGLPLDFLLSDLTLVGSGGLGAPNVTFDLVYAPIDLGDAPDGAGSVSPGNYNTRIVDTGPRHTIIVGLRMGANLDADGGSLQNAAANADDTDGALPDDEDGVVNPASDLVLTVGAQPRIDLRVTNATGVAATLFGWIDYNANGVFDTTESAAIGVPNGALNSTVTLIFPAVPAGFTGTTYARFRLSTDGAAASPIGPAANGEVEDYRVTINRTSTGTVDGARTSKIASLTGGGPSLANGDMFGSTVAPLGDLDGDGVEDMAVGAPSQTGSGSPGNVFVQFMNANGTVKAGQRISSGIGGGPVLAAGDYFGHGLAAIGDIDGDGITELAVGADKDDTGGYNRGAVHILFLNSNGTVKGSQKIAHNLAGGPPLLNNDRFGSSITSLGDLDGDGVIDIAVGAAGDDTEGSYRGAVHVLFLNTDGSVKTRQKIASGVGGGPVLTNGDVFGIGVASLGDLDGDRVSDLAVGAFFDDTGGPGRGAVHVLFMNTNGTAKASQKIASGVGGGPVLADGDYFGRSVASLGDLDGDGVTDLGVGAYRDDTGGTGRGAFHVLLLNANGTVKQSTKIASSTGGGPVLANDSRFGSGAAALGDLDGDGRVELAVGAETDSTAGTARGAVYVLFLQRENTNPVIITPSNVSVPENSTTVMTVVASDVDVPPQPISFSIAGGPDQARFAITSGGLLTFVSPPNFEAPTDANGDNVYVVTVQATDTSGGTGTQTISVAVTPVNDNLPLITSPDAVSVPENTTAVITVTASDADLPPQPLTFSIFGGADQARFTITPGGALRFVTPPNFEAPTDANGDNVYVVIVQASDGTFSALKAILVAVTNVEDRGPVFTSSNLANVPENSILVTTVTAVDPDVPPQPITFSLAGGADQARFNISSGGILSFISPPNFEAPTDANGDNVYVVDVRASDGTTASIQTMLVTVTPVNEHEPVFTSIRDLFVPENTVTLMTVTATDADLPAQPITFSIVGGEDHPQFTITSGGLLSFRPPAGNFEAPTDIGGDNEYIVRVEARDGNGRSAQQRIVVTVAPVNDNAPVFTSPGAVSVAEGTTAVMTVTASDADLPPQPRTFSIVGGADQSKFNIAPGGALSFITPPDFEAPTDANGDNTYVVIVQASDGTFSTLQAILVTVNNLAEQFVGDYNRNGVVDAADYVLWRNTLGSVVPPTSGADGNGDGVVSSADYNVWRANFGRTFGTGSAVDAVIESFTQTASASLRPGSPRPAHREAFAAESARDRALVAWLAARPVGLDLKPTAVSFAGAEKIAAGEPEPSIDLLDLAFAAV
jgi:serralysin